MARPKPGSLLLSFAYHPTHPDYLPVPAASTTSWKPPPPQRRRVALQYFNDLRQLRLDSGAIDTLFVRDKVGLRRLNSGEETRLDHIIRVDDKPTPGGACCPGFSCAC